MIISIILILKEVKFLGNSRQDPRKFKFNTLKIPIFTVIQITLRTIVLNFLYLMISMLFWIQLSIYLIKEMQQRLLIIWKFRYLEINIKSDVLKIEDYRKGYYPGLLYGDDVNNELSLVKTKLEQK